MTITKIIFDHGWYFTTTLMAGSPDRNKRTLYCGGERIAVFNEVLEPWPPTYDALLQTVCDNLNKIAGIEP